MGVFHLPSKRLIASYIFDWVVIFGIAGVAGGVNSINPFHKAFSVLDLSISYPIIQEQVPSWLLFVLILAFPAATIFLVCLILIPGRNVNRRTSTALMWRRKFWEWNTGWMGLGLSLATTWLITNGMKNLFGKPRPNMLARCNPDLANIAQYAVGGYGQDISDRWQLVNSGICRPGDRSIFEDGFRSFPSGHASSSWAGLLYLTLFLCSKFAIAIPFLPPRPYSSDPAYTAIETEQSDVLPLYHTRESSSSSSNRKLHPPNSSHDPAATNASDSAIVPIRNQAAAPPNWLLVLALVPLGVAVYICSSRYADYYHHGFDIISGALIGIVCAWFSFRWYHLPIRQGAGWAWGARSRDRAFYIGVGTGSYVGMEGWGSKR